MKALPRPDFLRPQRGVPPLAWAALAAALLALGVAGADAWQALDERSSVAEALDGLQRVPARAPPATDRAEPGLLPLQQALQRPWRSVFEAVEAAAPAGIAWTAMEVGDAGDLHLVGVSAAGAGALDAADRLRASGRWRSVVLTRMEQGEGGVQRFEIRAAVHGEAR